MWTIFFLTPLALAQPEVKPPPEIVDQIENTRASISQDERQQREALSHLFLINKNVKDITHKQAQLNDHLLSLEAQIRAAAQEVGALEERSEKQKGMLNKRLRQLYQERKQDDFHWLFSAQSPVELERNHRFLRRMIDSDHRQLKVYISNLTALQKKRSQLKGMVAHFAGLQKAIQAQETQLSQQLREKSKFLEELRKSKEFKLTQLKGLRQENGALDNLLSYAFFERKGVLHPPIEGQLKREYGTYVDPQFRFHLTHKGLFYAAPQSTSIHAVFDGKVVFADQLPGYGRTLIVDHGDNYYSVYAFAQLLKVQAGAQIHEGAVLGLSGKGSPLFGPGLYFEIRHFTDAIDPRPWIKDSVIETAEVN